MPLLCASTLVKLQLFLSPVSEEEMSPLAALQRTRGRPGMAPRPRGSSSRGQPVLPCPPTWALPRSWGQVAATDPFLDWAGLRSWSQEDKPRGELQSWGLRPTWSPHPRSSVCRFPLRPQEAFFLCPTSPAILCASSLSATSGNEQSSLLPLLPPPRSPLQDSAIWPPCACLQLLGVPSQAPPASH